MLSLSRLERIFACLRQPGADAKLSQLFQQSEVLRKVGSRHSLNCPV